MHHASWAVQSYDRLIHSADPVSDILLLVSREGDARNLYHAYIRARTQAPLNLSAEELEINCLTPEVLFIRSRQGEP